MRNGKQAFKKFSIECMFPNKFFENNYVYDRNAQNVWKLPTFFSCVLYCKIYYIQKSLFIIEISWFSLRKIHFS